MLFDTNPSVLSEINGRMRSDPRVLKWTTLRKGVSLDEVTQQNSFQSKTVHYSNPVLASEYSVPPSARRARPEQGMCSRAI